MSLSSSNRGNPPSPPQLLSIIYLKKNCHYCCAAPKPKPKPKPQPDRGAERHHFSYCTTNSTQMQCFQVYRRQKLPCHPSHQQKNKITTKDILYLDTKIQAFSFPFAVRHLVPATSLMISREQREKSSSRSVRERSSKHTHYFHWQHREEKQTESIGSLSNLSNGTDG